MVLVALLGGCSANSSREGSGGADVVDSSAASASQASSAASVKDTRVVDVAGASFKMPDGFEGTPADSKYDPTYYYAEKGSGSVVMIMTQTDSIKIDSNTDLKKAGDDIIEGIVSSEDSFVTEIIEDKTTEISGMPGRIVTANGVVKNTNLEIVIAFFFNDDDDEVGFLLFGQTANAARDYKQDFMGMVFPSFIPNDVKETIKELNEQSKVSAEEKARQAAEEKEKKAAEEEAKRAAEEESARAKAGAENEKATLAERFPVDDARKAATVALNNSLAYDVYAGDGNSHDPSLYHSFSDRSGCYLELLQDGKWTAKDGSTWHVSNIRFGMPGVDTEVKASLDVRFDGANYVVSNISGMEAIPGRESTGTNLKHIEEWQPDGFEALTVPPYLLA